MSEPRRPASNGPFWKLIALALFLSLIGVYLLYSWYEGRLQAQIAEKDALLVQQSNRLKETEAKRLAAEGSLQASHAEIERLKAEFQAERQALKDQIRLLEEAKTGLGQDLEGVKAAHAKALAEERRKTAEVAAERDRLQAEHTAQRQELERLKADLEQLRQAVAESAESHRKRIAELERHLNERLSLARTTPEDAELLRRLQQLGLGGGPAKPAAEVKALTAELEATRTELTRLHQEHLALRSQLEESQNALEQARAALALKEQEVASQTLEGRTAHERIAQLESELASERSARAELQKGLGSLQQALGERERQIAQLQAEQGEAGARQDQQEALSAAESRIRELESALETLRAQSAQVQAALQQELEAARVRLTELETKLEETQDKAKADAQALADSQARIQSLVAELNQARAQSQELDAARARISALESELAAIRQQAGVEGNAALELGRLRAFIAELAGLNGTFTEEGVLVRLPESELRFQPGRAELPSGSLPSIDRLAALLKAHPELKARIEGHTDSSGNPALNQTLSQQRAESVRAALIERGIAPERLTAEGLGPSRPLADNSTADGRARNRRVEVYLLR